MKLHLIMIFAALLLAAPALAQPQPVEVDVEPETDGAGEPGAPDESIEDLGTISNPFAGREPGLKPAVASGEGAEEGDGDQERTKKDEGSLLDELMDRVDKEQVEGWAAPARPRWPWVEWHGYFRFRADLMGRLDIGTYSPVVDAGTSRIKPPLSKNLTNSAGGAIFDGRMGKAKEKAIGTTNMRFRLQPTIHVWDRIWIHTTVDFLDNIVLGSTPDVGGTNLRPVLPLDMMTRTQVSPTAGVNSFRDAVAVKEAYAEWLLVFDDKVRPDSFNLGLIQVGRFAYPWGMGIISSKGDYNRNDPTLDIRDRRRALDMDGGSYVDRFMWTWRVAGINLTAGYGWLGTGPTSQARVEWDEQPYDLEQSDDIHQVEFAIHKRPVTTRELEERYRKLHSGKPILDWGLYTTARWQANAVFGAVCCVGGEEAGDSCMDCYGDMALMDRSAWVVTPDLWLRLDWKPSPITRFRAQIEMAMNIGRIEHGGDGLVEDFDIDVLSWGGGLETIFWWKMVGFGLDAGVASGDSAVLQDPSLEGADLYGNDGKSSLFSFHRDYIVDMILYREVLGGVYNSFYVRPHFIFDLLSASTTSSFGGTVAALYSGSVDPEGTPGNSRHLGMELEAGIFYEERNRFFGSVDFGVLFPFDGLDRPEGFGDPTVGAKAALWSWTLQAQLGFVF